MAGGGPVTRTFVFTDIEGSTRGWQSAPDGMAAALERHDSIIRSAVAGNGGAIVKHTGDGFLAVFDAPRAAIAAAVEAQRRLAGAVPFRVRMAVATGEARPRDGDWFGPAVNRSARLMEAGHGGQVLVSAATAALVRDAPLGDIALVDLGEHRLRDLPDAESVFQVQAPEMAERHPPLRTAAAPVHTLPAARTPLVGRERELAELRSLVNGTRLLTITGVGGVGKTRLALELAGRLLERHPGGTFFAELAAVADGAAVDQAVAGAVGLEGGGMPGAAAGSARAQLTAFLAGRTALVVLDNCEHLLDECADLVDLLLDRCPHLTVVATSREPLAVDGEQVWRAPSLPAEGEDADAVRLFLERAGAVRPELRDDAELATIGEICRRLDGIPLAIELAAAQVAHLPVSEIAMRLDDRFSLLTGGRRRVQRQQTLLAAVEWSHGMLTDDERTLFRRLAAFPSWFDLTAVEAVCAEGLAQPPLRLLGSLVAKSLVIAGGHGHPGGYRLLETMRLYAEDRLVAAGEAEVVRRRHRDWVFARLTVFGPTDTYDFDAADHVSELADDLRAGLAWSVSRGEMEAVARALLGSGSYWWLTGRHDEGITWFTAALEAGANAGLDSGERALLRAGLAALLMMAGDFSAAAAQADAATAEDPDPMGNGRLEAELLQGLLGLLTDPLPAGELLRSVAERAASAGRDYLARTARDYRAHLLLALEPPEVAMAEWEDLVATSDARRRYVADFFALVDLAAASHLTGDDGRTLELAAELDRRGFSLGQSWNGYSATYLRALAAAGRGDLEAARGFARSMVATVRRHGIPLGEQDCGLACAAILTAAGDAGGALRVLGAVRGIGERLSLRSAIAFGIHRHYTARARAALPADVAARVYGDGRAADLVSVVDQALGGAVTVAPS